MCTCAIRGFDSERDFGQGLGCRRFERFHLDGIPSAVLEDWVGVVADEGLDSFESLSLVLKSVWNLSNPGGADLTAGTGCVSGRGMFKHRRTRGPGMIKDPKRFCKRSLGSGRFGSKLYGRRVLGWMMIMIMVMKRMMLR